jgi:acetoin:2,6-dichlorophenolindophenol oxidoreductase subunit beta
VLAACAEESLHDVDDVWRITTPEHPIPYSPTLEDAFLPGAEFIAAAVRTRVKPASLRA